MDLYKLEEMEGYVTDLETSRRLTLVGVDNESQFVWVNSLGIGWSLSERAADCVGGMRDVNAYLLSELLEILKYEVKIRKTPSGYFATVWHRYMKVLVTKTFRSESLLKAVSEALIFQTEKEDEK
jgi:hypothetical protein